MNRSSWLLSIGLLMAACNGHDKSAREEEAAILKKPPYATLTDSIHEADKGKLAGLYFRRGELLSRNDMHELAANDFKKSWELHPDETTGLRYASTLTIIGRLPDAIKLLRECQQNFPSNVSFGNMLGDLYLQAGEMKEALQLYDNMLKTDSMNFEAWYEKGLLLEKSQDTAGALAALNKAYTLQPVNTYALELAHLYAENRNAAAVKLCDDVLKKDSAHELIDPLFIKGIYYANTGQHSQAIVQFDSCIRRDWKFTDAYLEKGIVIFHEKKYQQAAEIFQMTIRVSNTYPDGYYWLGRCYEATGHKEDAIQYYQRALSLDRDFNEAREAIKRLQ